MSDSTARSASRRKPRSKQAQGTTLPRQIVPDYANFSALTDLIGGHVAPAILVRPKTGRIMYANKAAIALYGYAADQLIGMTVEELSAQSVNTVRSIRRKALEGVGTSLPLRHCLANGEERELLAHSSPIELDGEQFLLSVLQDVTPLHDARKALAVRQEQFDLVVAASNSGILDLNLLSGELTASDTVWDLLGVAREDYSSASKFVGLLHPEDASAVSTHCQRSIERRERFERRFRLRRGDGHYIWVLGTAKAVYDNDGQPIRYVGSIRDISFTMRIESDLRASETRYRRMFEASPVPMLVVDSKLESLLEANLAAMALYGLDRHDVVGRQLYTLMESPSDLDSLRDSAESGGLEMRHRSMTGKTIDVCCSCCHIGADNQSSKLLMIEDLTQRKADANEIERLATVDPVTGMNNRTTFETQLSKAVDRAKKSGKTGALLVINLDSFNAVNSAAGRLVADQVLFETGQRLLQAAGANDSLARQQADEFALICHGMHTDTEQMAAQAGKLAADVLSVLREPYVVDGMQFTLTGSVGISLFGAVQNQDDGPEQTLHHCESAVRQAKQNGGDAFRYFDPDIQRDLDARSGLELDLRRAANESQFELYYQLQVDQHANAIGAEVLLRWNHPTRGVVPPMQFIELAEETGVIISLGQWVIEQACYTLSRWAGIPGYENLKLSVNVSARQFRQPDFVPQVTRALADSGARPELLTLELTESMLLDYADKAIEKMHDLRMLGVGFSLDDFGTGYSSLAYLKRLPLDEIKIDRGFIRDILTDPNDAVIVRTIIGMANNLGLALIAEGVECAGQHETLTRWGCTGFQGYHFGRPIPASAFTTKSASLTDQQDQSK